MSKKEKEVRELALSLNSNNTKTISKAIKSLRQRRTFSGAISLLASYFDKTADPQVKDQIKNFMNDLKDPAFREEVIGQINNPYKDETISMLVSSCWQSGLDYSDYGMQLANAFLNGSYVTAFECFTVMEVSVANMTRNKKNQIIMFLTNYPETEITDKTVLTRELLKLLK